MSWTVHDLKAYTQRRLASDQRVREKIRQKALEEARKKDHKPVDVRKPIADNP